VTLVGELALWVALLMAGWAAFASALTVRLARPELGESGRRALVVVAGALAVSVAAIVVALQREELSLALVAATTSHVLAPPLRVASLWGAPAGTTLVGALLVALGLLPLARRGAPRAPRVVATSAALLLLPLAVLCAAWYPFERLAWTAPEGAGLDPRLHHPLAIVQPLLRLAGFALVAQGAALAAAAVAARDAGTGWWREARRALTLAWLVLGVAILAGAWWGYSTFGWAGGWAWMPVDDLTLPTWLAALAFALLARTRAPQRTPRWWIAALPLAALACALLGAYALAVAPVDGLRAALGREAGKGLALLVVVGLAAALWLVRRRIGRASEPTMDDAAAMPATDGRAMSGRAAAARIGAAISLLGALGVGVALAGVVARRESIVRLRDGQSAELLSPGGTRWRLTSQGVSRYPRGNVDATTVALDLRRDGRPAGILTAAQLVELDEAGHSHGDSFDRPGWRSPLRSGLLVALEEAVGEEARLRVVFTPGVGWLWVGGLLVLAGGAVALRD
jgi:cytochrome c biogenesis factor